MGGFATPHILSESIGAILMWSLLLLSRLSSTFTNMCIRAMIVPLWSLADAEMNSSSTWMHATLVTIRLYGNSISLAYRSRFQIWFAFGCIFIRSKELPFVKMKVVKMLLLNMQIVPPLSQVSLKQTLLCQRMIPVAFFSIRTIPPKMSGMPKPISGPQEHNQVLP